MKQTKTKFFLRCLLFIVGLITIFNKVQNVFGGQDKRPYQLVRGFYEEKKDSLDAVYVGASNVYAFWQAPLVWNEFGYMTYPMSVVTMPPQAVKYMIEECRKTQPEALYIVNVNNFYKTNVRIDYVHYITDYMPLSMTKVKMINELTGACDVVGIDKLEYYFPIIRFHAKWNELESTDFERSLEGLKGGVHYGNFLNTSIDNTSNYYWTEERSSATENQKKVLMELLTYCKEEDVKILFVAVPQGLKEEGAVPEINKLCDIIEEQGYSVLNLQGNLEETGLDMTTDYYDNKHTNIHGSLKYTHYLGKYLSENYGFEDKRSNPDYESWNVAYDKYLDIIAPYAPDFELNHEKRDYSIQAPKLLDCTVVNQDLKVEWEKSEGANGYLIYCRTSAGDSSTYTAWECIGEAEEEATSYTVNNPDADLTYNYTVVPIRTENENTYYGKYNMDGINGKVVTE